MTPGEAWAHVVAGEDAAVYAYSVAGARVSQRRQVLAGLAAHRARRSRAATIAQEQGVTPKPPAPAYELPSNVQRAAIARQLLADVDLALVAAYADAAAASAGEDRRWAARTAAASAVSAVGWGAPSQAFPTAPSDS